tara:strand:+ start:781 stop:993 length:213 start_codon:yes stop_codon:yes gene_type:complete
MKATDVERKFVYVVEGTDGVALYVCDDGMVAQVMAVSAGLDSVYPMEITTEKDLNKRERNLLTRLEKQEK